ncbi:excalibur calcium-binding domain-containing protein [Nocardia veterana]|uniref:Excalibur calcium-binding domain-containing protein n=1 Tax=Nocardia veterana TaxID=132249 RepID=A0A7X6RIB7_9NOCA|nr:excalibur calcium-binding domain-containing protein [Nocardia veterana]NKY87007.1 excalibur calcium-binding domain-containing protein [Nocardia veterana]
MSRSLRSPKVLGTWTVAVAAAACAALAPAAAADPITDALCGAGSSQFCPAIVAPAPAAPAPAAPPAAQSRPAAPAPERSAPPQQPGVYYKNCTEARRAGVAPLHRGDPGYAPHLDRDNDGIACE